MRKSVLFGVAMASLAAAACSRSRAEDAGPMVQRNYQVGNFTEMEVAGPFDVAVHTGAAPSVSAKGNQKLLEELVVEVKGDRLLIHTQEHRGIFSWGSGTHGSAKLDVTVPMLSKAVIAGSGGITVDTIKGDSFEGAVAGSGDLNLDSVQVQNLKLAIGGSGDIRARSGQAAGADYSIAGSGDIDARGVTARTAEASIAGSGGIHAQATQTAKANIMGSGDVTLIGGAKCEVSKMGSGDVNCS